MSQTKLAQSLRRYALGLALVVAHSIFFSGPEGWAQETRAAKKLHTFESGWANSEYDGFSYQRSFPQGFVGAAYSEDAYPSHYVGWNYNYFGYLRLDPTQGAKGTGSSLRATVTGGNPDEQITGDISRCGGPITSLEDLQENPDYLCTDSTNQSFFVWFIHSRPNMNGRNSFLQGPGADRLSFYIKLPAVFDQSIGRSVGWVGSQHYNLHVGTYPIHPATQESRPRNEDTHYYHWISMNGGGWVHVLLDSHPQHERNGGSDPGLNPTQRRWGYDYFDGLSAFYIGDVNFTTRPTPWSVNIDEIEFYNTADTPEANQNDQTIASMAVGYYPGDGHWEMNWYDSYQCEYCMATYEVRYSDMPITNANFDKARPIEALRYGPAPDGVSSEGLVRKQGPWGRHVWTRFYLPETFLTGKKVYFAVRDVSAQGQHCRGENYENARCDNRDAPNDLIHTIDYEFAPFKEDANDILGSHGPKNNNSQNNNAPNNGSINPLAR